MVVYPQSHHRRFACPCSVALDDDRGPAGYANHSSYAVGVLAMAVADGASAQADLVLAAATASALVVAAQAEWLVMRAIRVFVPVELSAVLVVAVAEWLELGPDELVRCGSLAEL